MIRCNIIAIVTFSRHFWELGGKKQQVLNRASLAVSPKMEATQMEIFNSVAYLGPIATLTSHLKQLTPLTPVATQITKGKKEKKVHAPK